MVFLYTNVIANLRDEIVLENRLLCFLLLNTIDFRKTLSKSNLNIYT